MNNNFETLFSGCNSTLFLENKRTFSGFKKVVATVRGNYVNLLTYIHLKKCGAVDKSIQLTLMIAMVTTLMYRIISRGFVSRELRNISIRSVILSERWHQSTLNFFL